jgi:RNA polymerase primary sigma factor
VNNRQPKIEEMAEEAGIPVEDVEFLLPLSNDNILLGQTFNHEETNVLEKLEDFTYNPERLLMKKNSKEATNRILNELKDNEKHVLIHRFSLDGKEVHTLKKISVKLGFSAETVRQIELRALQKLRPFANDLKQFADI